MRQDARIRLALVEDPTRPLQGETLDARQHFPAIAELPLQQQRDADGGGSGGLSHYRLQNTRIRLSWKEPEKYRGRA
jgi:hypothetical protein